MSYFGVGASSFGALFVHGDEVFSGLFVRRWFEFFPSTNDFDRGKGYLIGRRTYLWGVIFRRRGLEGGVNGSLF